ncbi:MAG: DUF3892 domain-containing protein [Alphaproteobacteria bacterium]|nr:DUF3892 domain-containing protein [Alphaproteobacteria bacterium]
MASRHQVHCVSKTDRMNHHERIRSIGGVNADGSRWKIAQHEAIEGIETGQWSFFITRAGRDIDIVIAVSKYGSKYIKAAGDGLHPDTLLTLPDCP